MPPTAVLATLSQRFGELIARLCAAVAALGGRDHSLGPLVLRTCSFLRRVEARFVWLTRNADRPVRRRAPHPPPPADPPPASQQPARERPARPPPTRHPAEAWRSLRLPRRSMWLLRMDNVTVGAFGSGLRHLLLDPDMAAFLAATPRAGRVLRTLCRSLGIGPAPDLPPGLFPPAPPRKKRPPRPKAPVTRSHTAAAPPGWPWKALPWTPPRGSKRQKIG